LALRYYAAPPQIYGFLSIFWYCSRDFWTFICKSPGQGYQLLTALNKPHRRVNVKRYTNNTEEKEILK